MLVNILIFILGALPFFFGGILNWIMTIYSDNIPPYVIIGFLFLLFWGIITYLLKSKIRNTKKVVILLNTIAAIDLLLLGIQELVIHAYWMNVIGVWSQMFYLPLLNIGFKLTSWSHTLFSAYCVSFVLMAAASFLGCRLSVGKE